MTPTQIWLSTYWRWRRKLAPLEEAMFRADEAERRAELTIRRAALRAAEQVKKP